MGIKSVYTISCDLCDQSVVQSHEYRPLYWSMIKCEVMSGTSGSQNFLLCDKCWSPDAMPKHRSLIKRILNKMKLSTN